MEDLEEWEVLPEDGFLEIHDDDDGKKIFSRKYAATAPEIVFKNYFICPSPTSSKFVETTDQAARGPNQLVPVPIQLEEPAVEMPQEHDPGLKQITKAPIDMTIRPSAMPEVISSPPKLVTGEADQDLVSQVFFKKMKEAELQFVDMKMDSPKSNNNNTYKGNKPQTDAGAFQHQLEEKAEVCNKAGETQETSKISSPRSKVDREDKMINQNNCMDAADLKKEVNNWDENCGGQNILKWSLTGIGAICSFGVATVCVLVLGGCLRKNKQHQPNQKLQFHIYTQDKRMMKQVVHRATKLNEAISAVRGVPIARAQITFGGYYDGL